MFPAKVLIVALVLLAYIVAKLARVHALLQLRDVHRPVLSEVPAMLARKAALAVYGFFFLLFSSDKVRSSDLRRLHEANSSEISVHRKLRIIFIRHGESVWNYVFNRGFGPSFLVRLLLTTLHELYLLPWEDSAYIDSPLSPLGEEQCTALQKFLSKPCLDSKVRADFSALTNGEGNSLIVSSQLRRAASTAEIALLERLQRSSEAILIHSSCQEISRNFDTMALAPKGGTPRLDVGTDGSANAGNKTFGFRGIDRVQHFARWVADRPEPTIIVVGHSLWFRSFFQAFLPAESDHVSKKRKIVNCGVVGFTLEVGRDGSGVERHRIDPGSVDVIYGGFASK